MGQTHRKNAAERAARRDNKQPYKAGNKRGPNNYQRNTAQTPAETKTVRFILEGDNS